ncbi:MAG: glycosyltransferase [bacterium]|nr:glycosyltransferase [bacterium]
MNRATYALAVSGIVILLVVLSFLLFSILLDLRIELPTRFLQTSFLMVLGFLVLLIMRYFGLLWFSYLAQLEGERSSTTKTPLVTILVPAYNEGLVIQGAIRSLFELDYPRYEILVIDDGSTDDTYQNARAFEGDHGRVTVRVIRKRNGGKSSALNTGIANAKGELILCMDGDSRLSPDTLRKAVRHFSSPSIAAVAGSVKVANRNSLLARLQALEYVEGLNMVRKAQGFFHAVNIIPGPIGMFRRGALDSAGRYDSDTFAEDCDLTLKMLIGGWQIHYEPGAVAYTEAPEHALDLLKQRYRWTRGILQAMKKHRRTLVSPFSTPTACATLWYMVFEGIAWPFMNVFAHILFVFVAYSHGNALPLVFWFLQLTILDMAAALYCVSAEEESIGLVPYAIFYRMFFALCIDFAKVFATFEELFGVRMGWGKLERLGRI